MRPDHTATDFAVHETVLATSLDVAEAHEPRRPSSALTRMTFCFAWLFGLEPFLTAPEMDAPRSRIDRH